MLKNVTFIIRGLFPEPKPRALLSSEGRAFLLVSTKNVETMITLIKF